MTTLEILKHAKAARAELSMLDTETKNRALQSMADALLGARDEILAANALDLENAKGHVSDVMLDRLRLTPERLEGMADGIRQVVHLPDPVGTVIEQKERPNGLCIQKVRVPIGVVAIIYESRPNVTSDAAALALTLLFREGPELVPEKDRHGKYCAKLNDNEEHLLEALGDIKLQELIEEYHMTRGADGKPFGDPLNYSDYHGFQVFYKSHRTAPYFARMISPALTAKGICI